MLENVKFNPKYESDAHTLPVDILPISWRIMLRHRNSFTRVSKKDQRENLGHFQVEMNFKLGRFEKAISLAEKEIQNEAGENFSELSKILGESYFNTQQYDKALIHLINYKGKRGKWTHEDFYQLGYAYYETRQLQSSHRSIQQDYQ